MQCRLILFLPVLLLVTGCAATVGPSGDSPDTGREATHTTRTHKVPILGSIPILGSLFTQTTRTPIRKAETPPAAATTGGTVQSPAQ